MKRAKSSIRIRKIRQTDFTKAGNVVKRANKAATAKIYPDRLVKEFEKKYSPSSFRVRARTIEYFVAEEKGSDKIVGIIGIKGNQLRTFYVDPPYQKKVLEKSF